MKRRTWLTALLILLLWLATALRFYRLEAQSLWNDEGNSARLSERSVALIIEGAAGDIHPPLYYLMLGGWRHLLGDTEFGLRAMSAFAGVGIVALTYAVGRVLLQSGSSALVAALLVAINPALVYYSQEARMYALLALWAALSTLLLLRLLPLLDGALGRSLFRRAVAYVLVAAAGLYTHYFFPAVLLAHTLIVLVWLRMAVGGSTEQSNGRGKRRSLFGVLLSWLVLLAAAAALYLPWAPIFLRQAGGRPGDTTAPLAFLSEAARWLAFGATAVRDAGPWPLVAIALLLLLGAIWALRNGAKPGAGWTPSERYLPASVAAVMLVVPVAFMLMAGTTRPAYYKFMLVAVPFWPLLVGAALDEAVRSGSGRITSLWRGLATGGLLAIIASGMVGSLQNLYFDPAYARADYRGIAREIAAAGHPDAGIVLNAPNQWEVFTYYHRDGAPVYPIPRQQPDATRIAAELSAIADRHDRLYALFWGEAERDPQRLVERWLDAHAFKAGEEWVGDVRFVTYAVPPQPAVEMETEAGVVFGDEIELSGFTLRGERLQAGDIVQVTLFWQARVTPSERYKVFLHLLDEEGRLVGQRDAEPGGNMSLTTTWQPGQTIVDNHGLLLPPDTPRGEYSLVVGLYPLADPAARLPVAGSGSTTDSYRLGTVMVR